MDQKKQLNCKSSKCKGQSTIPLKVISGKHKLLYIARCPNCHKEYKDYFSFGEREDLIEFIRPQFTACDACGANNSDNWEPVPFTSKLETIIFQCNHCGKKRKKTATPILMKEILDSFEEKLKNKEREDLSKTRFKNVPVAIVISEKNWTRSKKYDIFLDHTSITLISKHSSLQGVSLETHPPLNERDFSEMIYQAHLNNIPIENRAHMRFELKNIEFRIEYVYRSDPKNPDIKIPIPNMLILAVYNPSNMPFYLVLLRKFKYKFLEQIGAWISLHKHGLESDSLDTIFEEYKKQREDIYDQTQKLSIVRLKYRFGSKLSIDLEIPYEEATKILKEWDKRIEEEKARAVEEDFDLPKDIIQKLGDDVNNYNSGNI